MQETVGAGLFESISKRVQQCQCLHCACNKHGTIYCMMHCFLFRTLSIPLLPLCSCKVKLPGRWCRLFISAPPVFALFRSRITDSRYQRCFLVSSVRACVRVVVVVGFSGYP